MADPKTKDHSGDMENDLHRLEDHIDEAGKKLEARRKDADAESAASGEAQSDGEDPDELAGEEAASPT